LQELEDDESEEEIIPEPDREDAWMTSGPEKWVLRSSFGDVKNGGLSMNDEVLLKNLLHGILKCRASPELTWNPKNQHLAPRTSCKPICNWQRPGTAPSTT